MNFFWRTPAKVISNPNIICIDYQNTPQRSVQYLFIIIIVIIIITLGFTELFKGFVTETIVAMVTYYEGASACLCVTNIVLSLHKE